VIAHDRRGHGRSSQPWGGNDLDTYADDLAALTAAHAAVKIAPQARLKVYPGAPHGLCSTHRTRSTRMCSSSSRHKDED